MFERAYRQRLEGDVTRWQMDGVITPATGNAIRTTLGPLPSGVNIASVVGIVGGLLIGAAFLAFVAANWSEIARPARFAMLLAGIAAAYALGAWFDRGGRAFLADSAVSIGCIIFGAAIALVGQMYHLGGDFAGAMLLWAAAALAAAALTGSRGALAVALVVGSIWSGMRVQEEADVPHLAFVAFWLIAAILAVRWNASVARHLVALAAVAWWLTAGITLSTLFSVGNATLVVAAGAALMLGAGLAMANWGSPSLRAFGLTLSTYGALVFAIAVAWTVSGVLHGRVRPLPWWIGASGVSGVGLSLAAAGIGRRAGPALAGLSAVLGLAVVAAMARRVGGDEPWLVYALALASMLSLVMSGMLDEVRPRIVPGWIGLACVIAGITWALEGSLLERSIFLAIAGIVAIAIANALGRFMPKEAMT